MTARFLTIVFSALLVFASNADANRSTKPRAVTITASAVPWIAVGSHVRITGSVTPHLAGIVVTLQQRKETGWLPVSDKTVPANGAFSFVALPEKAGLATYRVVTPKGTNYVGSSARVPVRVLRWSYLGSNNAFYYVEPLVGDLSTDPIVSDGVPYEHPVALDPGCYNSWDGSAWIDYPLERQYEMFTATVGIGDTVPTTRTVTYSIIGAGKKLASGSLVAGQSTKIKVSVSGVYRLRLMINVPDPTHAGGCGAAFPQVVFGDAQLLGP